MNENENRLDPEVQEFDLDDILKEFASGEDAPQDERLIADLFPEDSASNTPEEPTEPDVPLPEEVPSGDTVRIHLPPHRVPSSPTSDTVRIDRIADLPETVTVEASQETPVEAEPQKEPFSDQWQPEYEHPIGEYVPPQPILFHPRSKLRELKRKLVAGPERRYYELTELGY